MEEYNEMPGSLEGHSNEFGLEPYALNLSIRLLDVASSTVLREVIHWQPE